MLREFCAENLTDIEAALNAGARRIELCDNLACGGTTPSAGVIEQAIALVHAYEGASVRVIIRPRGGDFVYSKSEFKAMETDIATRPPMERTAWCWGASSAVAMVLNLIPRAPGA